MIGNAFLTARNGLFFNNVTIANFGDATGLEGSATAGNLYWTLHTAWPGRAGNQSTSEAAYTGYNPGGNRLAGTRSGTTLFTLSGNEIVTASAVTFPKQTDAGTDVMMFWGLGTLISGAGVLLYAGALGGGPLKFVTAATDDLITGYEAHGLAANDRVVLYQVQDDVAYPTGLTEGTVYHVIATGLTSTAFSVSATQGGAAVNITVAGIARWQKVEPVQLGLNVAPSLDAGLRIITA